MEEEFYASIKLISGEEIFSLVSVDDQEDKTMLILNNPVTIDIITLPHKGIQGYKIDPWLRFADDDCFLLNMERVITISEVRDRESIGMYHKFIRQRKHQKSGLDGSQDPEEAVGYVSKVSEARIMFEKLYKKKADL
tara:strand:- start:9 stop:419 length:411 start_codon:yes stop_codon:yes gene_type:complete